MITRLSHVVSHDFWIGHRRKSRAVHALLNTHNDIILSHTLFQLLFIYLFLHQNQMQEMRSVKGLYALYNVYTASHLEKKRDVKWNNSTTKDSQATTTHAAHHIFRPPEIYRCLSGVTLRTCDISIVWPILTLKASHGCKCMAFSTCVVACQYWTHWIFLASNEF